MKKNQKTKPSKSIDKAFALISCMGSALMSVNPKTKDYEILHDRINKMMKVYSYHAGKDHYWKTSYKVQKIWTELLESHGTRINEDSVIELVNAFATLIPKQTFKELLLVPQPMIGNIKLTEPDDFIKICHSALRLEEKLNKEFGTKSITLIKPSVKKVKIKKPKVKVKTKAQLKHEAFVLESKQKKERKQKFLADLKIRAEKLKKEQV